MTTLFVTHAACLDHLTPPGHPERSDRLRKVQAVLAADAFNALKRAQAPEAALETIALCHPLEYVDALREATPEEGFSPIDADTMLSPGSFEAALRGVGGALHAVDEVVGGAVANAFVGVRPPGHHAESTRAMGFCLFNNAAIATRYAQTRYGLGRVALVDFDVHHGNGSQDIFWADANVLYCSTHQMPLYPGTGARDERGEHDTIVNAPLRAGDGGREFQSAFENAILPQLAAFQPELIVISAGFDAHERDPLAGLRLQNADFGWATRKIMDIADRSANGRVVSVLEGGYDLEGLGGGVAAHVTALMHG